MLANNQYSNGYSKSMGKISSYDEIASGRVTNPEVFDIATDIYSEMIDIGINDGTIHGGFIFGSVARGTQSRRSDFDGKIALASGKPENYEAAKGIINGIKQVCGEEMPMQIEAFPVSYLRNGTHGIERLFGQHLISCDLIVIGPKPEEYITFEEIPPAKDILAAYLSRKISKLKVSESQCIEESLQQGGLQRMVELPIAIARKAIQALTEERLYSTTMGSGSDKKLIAELGHELLANFGISDEYDSLLDADARVTQMLEDAITGKISRYEYNWMISDLHAKLPGAITWLNQVQDKILPEFDK